MANANASKTLSTSDTIIFDTSNGDNACGAMMFVNRDTSIWIQVNIRPLHAPGEYMPIPPNQTPIIVVFANKNVEQVSAHGETGSPILGFSVVKA